MIPPINEPFKPLKGGWGFQPMGPSPLGKGDIHDTFHVDRLGNLTGGHTTIQLRGGAKEGFPW